MEYLYPDETYRQAVYPIPVREHPIREDLEALEACRLIKIQRVALPRLAPTCNGTFCDQDSDKSHMNSTTPVHGAGGGLKDADKTAGDSPTLGTGAAQGEAQCWILSFRDLVVHQVMVGTVEDAS